jgi:hypothetical protein
MADNANPASGCTGPSDCSVLWKSGWYASKLHAVPVGTVFPEGRLGTVISICGQRVYDQPPTKWAQRYLARGVSHCKRCERLLAQNENNERRR